MFSNRPSDSDHNPSAPTLELKGVTVAYAQDAGFHKPHYALEDISFAAHVGEQIAVIGPNGAGKSTLLKLITGIVKAVRGEMLIFGAPSQKHTCIAYVPQRSQIDWSFPVTVEDVVMMGRARQIGLFRRARAADKKVVQSSLERLGIDNLAQKQIGELSGGQQQRVFIARALALETHLLLLDEPLTGLDAISQDAIFESLEGLKKDGVTILMATHDLSLVPERFERVMLINRQIVALGKPDEVLTSEHLLAAYGGRVAA